MTLPRFLVASEAVLFPAQCTSLMLVGGVLTRCCSSVLISTWLLLVFSVYMCCGGAVGVVN